jgi:protein SCO1/2
MLALALALVTAGCKPRAREPDPKALHGAVPDHPLPKPDFTLTATDGSRFSFRERTDGYLTLLFFGYTNCPDVCPVHMANLGAVMKKLPDEVTRRIRVVFVTTDPARDTRERLIAWLAHFDPSFIGLTGTEDEVVQAQRAAHIMPAQRDTTAGMNYTVGHAAYIIAYTPDNVGRAIYPSGVRQADWAHDLPLLLSLSGPAVRGGPAPASKPPTSEPSAPGAPVPEPSSPKLPVRVSGAYVLAMPGSDVAVAYFTVENQGTEAVTLSSAKSDVAREASFHRQRRAGNVVRMQATGPLTIPAGKSVRLDEGGIHLMLSALTRQLEPGDTVVVQLDFAGHGVVTVRAPVRPYGSEQ